MKNKLSFEESINRLEVVLNELEKDELTLDELLNHFAEGVELLKNCRGQLECAEKRLEELTPKE